LETNSSAALRNKGQKLDLGGIAKGFAADEAKRILIENGVKSALINLGGNILTLGNKEDGSPFRIGIQNPLRQTGQFIGVLSASDRTIVTSGTNERFFVKDGIRYHHIINPHTGYPAQTGLLSVTVVCENSMYADALTTSLFVLGVEKGLKLLEQTGDEAIFITDGNSTGNGMQMIMTKEIIKKFESVNQTL
jgi:thiamine biosynthesis lipoprotein